VRKKNKMKMPTSNQKVITRVRLQGIWQAMKYRCLNPNGKNYKYYGGRGITICDEWLDYNNFERCALANGYGDKLTIDRVDNGRGYSPENCQWLTKSEHSSKSGTGRKATGTKRGPKRRQLPEDLIKQWSSEGMGSKAITSQLKAELGITVSYKTIQRILSGERKRSNK